MVNNFCFDGWDQEESLFEDNILSLFMIPTIKIEKRRPKRLKLKYGWCACDSKEQNCICISSTWILDLGVSNHIVFQNYFPFTSHFQKQKK